MKSKKVLLLVGVLFVVLASVLAACGPAEPIDSLLNSQEGLNVVISKTDDPTITFMVAGKTYPVSYFSLYQAGTIVFMSSDGRQVSYLYPVQWVEAIKLNGGIPPVTPGEYPFLVVVGEKNIALWNTSSVPLVPNVVPPTPITIPGTTTPTPADLPPTP